MHMHNFAHDASLKNKILTPYLWGKLSVRVSSLCLCLSLCTLHILWDEGGKRQEKVDIPQFFLVLISLWVFVLARERDLSLSQIIVFWERRSPFLRPGSRGGNTTS